MVEPVVLGCGNFLSDYEFCMERCELWTTCSRLEDVYDLPTLFGENALRAFIKKVKRWLKQ